MKCQEKDCVLYLMQDNWRCKECLKEKSRVWYKPKLQRCMK